MSDWLSEGGAHFQHEYEKAADAQPETANLSFLGPFKIQGGGFRAALRVAALEWVPGRRLLAALLSLSDKGLSGIANDHGLPVFSHRHSIW